MDLRQLVEIGIEDRFAVDPHMAFFRDAEDAHRQPLAGGFGEAFGWGFSRFFEPPA
ncbi:MAG: hypothetical protein O3C21_03355 [Verrucomicrobia bacterium]|nr:hypothetical protein [Verrucomicrobiota bacterium]